MSILRYVLGPEQRIGTGSADLHHWKEMFPGLDTVSGERVTHKTAMGLSAYFGCLRNIGEDVAKLPAHVYRRSGQNRTEVDHPLHYLLNVEPNPDMSAMDFRQTITAHAAGMGNGYAEIVADAGARPLAFWPMDPDTVHPKREGGRLYYEVRVGGEVTILLPYQVLHLRGLAPDGIGGYNIPQLAREALGAALASQKFAAAFYGNGTWLGGVLEHPAALTDTALKHLRETWTERHGGAGKAHKPAILEEGMTYKQLGIAPEQAQMLETRQFGVEEVCRYFRMPPHKVQHLLRATFSNIEHQGLEYVGDCLMPWLIRWEQELKRKCFSAVSERALFVKHNATALLRADAKTRAEYYSTLLQNGVYSINEVRALEEMNAIEHGDDHRVQVNMQVIGEEPEEPEAPQPPQLPEPDDDERIIALLEGHRNALKGAYARVLRVEADKAERASNRNELGEWAKGFYAGHAGHVAEVLRPALWAVNATVIATGGGSLDMEATANELAWRHVLLSESDIALGALDTWRDGRAASAADEAIAYLRNQICGGAVNATT